MIGAVEGGEGKGTEKETKVFVVVTGGYTLGGGCEGNEIDSNPAK